MANKRVDLDTFAIETVKLPSGKSPRHVSVVRDDLLAGGTKVRGLHPLMVDLGRRVDEYVYAGPAYGYAQIALAECCRALGKSGTLFVAKRKDLHPYTARAKSLGTKIKQVPYGYLVVVQKRARDYVARQKGKGKRTMLIPWGGKDDSVVGHLRESMSSLRKDIGDSRVWVCVGSGTLLRAMAEAWPEAKFMCVEVGAEVDWDALPFKGRVKKVFRAPEKYSQRGRDPPPYPAAGHYESKVWQFLKEHGKDGDWVWNVAGDIPP